MEQHLLKKPYYVITIFSSFFEDPPAILSSSLKITNFAFLADTIQLSLIYHTSYFDRVEENMSIDSTLYIKESRFTRFVFLMFGAQLKIESGVPNSCSINP